MIDALRHRAIIGDLSRRFDGVISEQALEREFRRNRRGLWLPDREIYRLPKQAAIGTPTSIGTPTVGTTASTMTTTANIVAGDLVVVACFANCAATTHTSTCTDGTNTYTHVNDVNGSSYCTGFFYKSNAAAVSSGATITATYLVATSHTCIAAWRVTGVGVYDTPIFQSGNPASTAAPSITSPGAPTSVPYIIFGESGQLNTTTPVYVEASGYTNLLANTTIVTGSFGVGYKITSVTSAPTYNPTYTAGTPVQCLLTMMGFSSPVTGGLFLGNPMTGLGAGGPFFADPLSLTPERSYQLGWRQ